MSTPIISLDFDGCVHRYDSGWQGAAEIPDPPMPGAFEAIMAWQDAGLDVQIFSSRSNQNGGRRAMVDWFVKHGFPLERIGVGYLSVEQAARQLEVQVGGKGHHLIPLKFPVDKPPALVAIDDRCIRFEGTWPSAQDLRAFKPWKPA